MRHLEEGEIHAWLDGAVAADEAARIEAHVAGCPRCAGEVATARGLIAGASRILLALDDVPGGVIPGRSATAAATASPGGPARPAQARELQTQRTKAAERRHAPWFSRPLTRIAAGLVLAAGIGTVAVRQNADESNDVRIELVADQAGPVAPAVPLDTVAGAPAAAGDAFATGTELAPTVPATAAASTAAEGADFSRRAAVRLPAPTPPPAGRAGQGAAASAAAERAVVSAKAREASPAVVGAPTPPPVSVLEETRTVAAGGAAGGRAVLPPAGAALADTASRLRRLESTLRLQSVVVTGVTAGEQPPAASPPAIRTDSLAVGGLGAVARASLAGSCYALDLAPPVAVARGEMPLPRTMRIRLADIQNLTAFAPRQDAAANAQAAGIQRRAPARVAQAQPPAPALAPPVEAPETVEWEIAGRDSVVARRLAGLDVIVLRLAITGDEVTGTAAAQAATTPPVRVAGRRISCDGSF